ncbi:MAG: sigma-E factor negative regulatory protein [Betaproteobacteria bacterium]|nr:sigma-E factor negative regulatory protein [Betaproteobacteria bacterium]
MKTKISALMDGELEVHELSEPLAALGSDGEAFDTWRTYHLISDALQGRAMLANDCLRRVAARLAQEPILVGPLPANVAPPERARWFVPSALAASIAAVALVGWIAFAPQQKVAPLQPPVAQALQATRATPVVATRVVEKAAPTRLPMTVATRDYLIAHQAFSPRNSLQGMAPYVRSVSAESAPAKP